MKVKVENVNGERRYNISGKRYVSVTTLFTILERDGLREWKKRIGEEEADKITASSSNFGSEVHKACEAIALGGKVESKDPEVIAQADRFKRWLEVAVDEVEGVEEVVFSDSLGVAGTLDLLVKMRGDESYTVADIKTGAIKPLMALQLAGYAHLTVECTSLQPGEALRRIIIPLPRDGKGPVRIKEFSISESKLDLEAFKSLVNLYRWIKLKGGKV